MSNDPMSVTGGGGAVSLSQFENSTDKPGISQGVLQAGHVVQADQLQTLGISSYQPLSRVQYPGGTFEKQQDGTWAPVGADGKAITDPSKAADFMADFKKNYPTQLTPGNVNGKDMVPSTSTYSDMIPAYKPAPITGSSAPSSSVG